MIPALASGAGSLDLSLGPASLALVAVLFTLSFFFSGTETAMFSLQQVDRERLRHRGRSGHVVSQLVENRAALITTLLIGNESSNIALAAVAAALVESAAPQWPWLSVVLLTPALVLVSEITPKVLAFRFRAQWALLIGLPLFIFYRLVTPLRWVFAALANVLARMIGVPPESEEESWAEEELMVYIDRGAALGVLAPIERDIIESVFQFDDLTIERLMTPRPEVLSIPVDIPWPALLEVVRRTNHSRIPVYGKGDDDILGVLLVKDLLRYRLRPLGGARQLRSILLPPVFVPQTKAADSMLSQFLSAHAHMAFVVDEHGTFVGLITIDDLLDELLCEDDGTEESEITRQNDDSIIVKGSVDIEDFTDETQIALPHGDYHTLAGFVWHQLGRLPKVGDTLNHGGYDFIITEVEGRQVVQLLVQRSEGEVSS